YPPDHPPGANVPSNSPPATQKGSTPRDQAPPTIRALVLYTPAVRQAVTDPLDVVKQAVGIKNFASSISGVAMKLVLAKAAELNYSEKDFGSDLAMLRSSEDVAKLRDSVQAQVVFLLTTTKGACGLSTAVKAENKDDAFSVVNYDCAA